MTTNRFNIFIFLLFSFVCLMLPAQSNAQILNQQYDAPQTNTERSNKMEERYNLEDGSVQVTGKRGAGQALVDGFDTLTTAGKETLGALGDAGNALLEGDVLGAAGSTLKAAWAASTGAAQAAWSTISGLFKTGRELGTYTDPKTGKTYEFEIKKDGTMVATSGISEGCTPFPMKMAESKSCLFCPLFLVIYNACNTMATKSFATLGVPVANVMLIGFALYIAFVVLGHVSSFTKQDAPKFLTGMLVQSFKILVAYLLLTNADQIYYYFITPVLKAGMQLGSAMLFQTDVNLEQCAAQAAAPDDDLMPSSLYIQLDCFIRSVQSEIAYAQAMGSTLMCIARNAAASLGGLLWDFSMMFQGLVIYLFSLLLVLAFSFYLIDATVTIGLVGALLPLLIAAWPFKKTQSYTGKGFNMLMNTFFVYVFMGIVVSVNIQLIGHSLTSNAGGGMDGIEQILNEGNVEQLQKILDFSGGAFLILICCCIFGFKFVGQASSLAGTMASGGISGIGNKIGGMAASGATNIAQKVSKPITDPIKDKVSGAMNATADKARASVGKALGIGRYGKPKTASADNLKNRPAAGGNPTPTSGGTPGSQPSPDSNDADNRNDEQVTAAEQEAQNKQGGYQQTRQQNQQAWDQHLKNDEELQRTGQRVDALRKGFQQAEAEGDIEKMNAYGEALTQAEQQQAHAQAQFQQSEQTVQQTENQMNAASIEAHVARLKADAMREGQEFNEAAAREAAAAKIVEIQTQLNQMNEAGPRS